jgi:hypothetical protein
MAPAVSSYASQPVLHRLQHRDGGTETDTQHESSDA